MQKCCNEDSYFLALRVATRSWQSSQTKCNAEDRHDKIEQGSCDLTQENLNRKTRALLWSQAWGRLTGKCLVDGHLCTEAQAKAKEAIWDHPLVSPPRGGPWESGALLVEWQSKAGALGDRFSVTKAASMSGKPQRVDSYIQLLDLLNTLCNFCPPFGRRSLWFFCNLVYCRIWQRHCVSTD